MAKSWENLDLHRFRSGWNWGAARAADPRDVRLGRLAAESDRCRAGRGYFNLERDLTVSCMPNRSRFNKLALARHYGIGRGTARDLIFHAQSVGIVTRGSSGNWRIVPFDEKRCRDLYDPRILLETDLLRAAPSHIPYDDLTQREERFEAALDASPNLSISQLKGFRADLHQRLLDWAPNREMTGALVSHICGKYLQS